MDLIDYFSIAVVFGNVLVAHLRQSKRKDGVIRIFSEVDDKRDDGSAGWISLGDGCDGGDGGCDCGGGGD
jgi:hypothetical protein